MPRRPIPRDRGRAAEVAENSTVYQLIRGYHVLEALGRPDRHFRRRHPQQHRLSGRPGGGRPGLGLGL
ncbi:MAG: hypothetical protein JNK86_08205 [Alphaproteobacteria bacterium]|nr:hypothetical protein [Alphaproteobacteria bacterium]